MTQLSDYGKLLVVYSGSGTLHLHNGDGVSCGFDVAQTSDGRLYARCDLGDAHLHTDLGDGALRLAGSTDDGRELSLEEIRIVRNVTSYEQDAASRHIVLSGNHATVTATKAPRDNVLFAFALANLTLLGTEGYVIKTAADSTVEGLQIPLALGGLEIAIRRRPGYADIVRSLRATRGVDVTCEAVVNTDLNLREDDVLRVVGDLCELLSLARGCRVEWLSYEMVTPDGEVLKSYHRGNAITKPFGSFELIGPQPPGDTVDFVERAYPRLDAQRERWQFREAVNLYTDAKLDQDFFELRGLKMAIIIEQLKGCYLRNHGKTHILKTKTFDRARACLVDAVRWTLPDVFPEAITNQLDMMANHAQGFNWYPFRRATAELCQSLGLDLSSAERGRFVNIRNELVHRVEYNHEYGESLAQYCFLMTFVGKVLLAILGYDGYFYDWTRYNTATTKDDMRAKLHLDLGEAKKR